LSITDRCQLACRYCTPGRSDEAPRPQFEYLSHGEIFRFVSLLKRHFGLSKVRITGGEPLLRPDVSEIIEVLDQAGIEEIGLTTNGQLLRKLAPDLKGAGLSRVNVSLDSLDDDTYANLTRGGRLRSTLEGIEAALVQGLTPVKINTVVIRGVNHTEVIRLARWALDRGCSIRFLELMPAGYTQSRYEELFVSSSEVRSELSREYSLRSAVEPEGGTSRNFLATDRRGKSGTIGFISPESHPFCRGCRRLRLTCTGHLIACLAHGGGKSIRHLLGEYTQRAEEDLIMAVSKALNEKARYRTLRQGVVMTAIGG
jgi:cyclic pyranopterin phosphate synthase